MLETLRNAFKVKDIRSRIIFTFYDAYSHQDRM